MPRRFWLELADGSRRRLGAGGILVGRGPECDVVVDDPAASRVHALLHLGADGPEVVAMGRHDTQVDGQRVDRARALAGGERLALPGFAATLRSEPDDAAPAWILEQDNGAMWGVPPGGLTFGGPEADVHLPGLGGVALHFRPAGAHLYLERADGEVVAVVPGDAVPAGDRTLHVVAANTVATATTAGPPTPARADHVRLQFLPRGARLAVRCGGSEAAVWLAERRSDLVATLLRPPAPLRPGDWVEDDLLARRVWPGGDHARARTDINTLVHRVRRDLVAAGMDGPALLQRAPGGGATRFGLGTGAGVAVE